MKKISTILLSLMLLSLTACSVESTQEKSSTDTNVSQDESKESENSKEEKDEEESSAEEKDETSKKANNEMSFSEVIAVDNAECSIKITEIDPDNMWGFTLKTQIENKSADKTYMFSVEKAAINGVQCDPLFASEVAAGKKSNEEITFSTEKLDENGVGDYTDIELSFRVYDSNDWTADSVAKETVHIYPYGEEKTTAFVRESQASDNVIIDNDYVTAIVTGYEEDAIWGYTVNLFLLNKSDKNIMFSVDEASVNGFMADPFYAETVSAGKCSFSYMSFSDTTLEENGIETIEEIEFKLRAYDSDNFMGDDFANETITLKP